MEKIGDIVAVNGKWTCPFCLQKWDATDGYASRHNFDGHIKDHQARKDKLAQKKPPVRKPGCQHSAQSMVLDKATGMMLCDDCSDDKPEEKARCVVKGGRACGPECDQDAGD